MGALRSLPVVVLALVCLLVVGVDTATAASSEFGGLGEESGQFLEPRGVAVEQASGDVYLVDRNNARLEKFGGEGAFMFASGWGVADGSTQAAQTCTTQCFAGLSGSGAGQLDFPEGGVAVDNDPLSPSSGDVYVFDSRNSRVEKFDANGTFLLAFGGEVNESTHGNVCFAGEACEAGVPGTQPGEFEPASGDNIAVDAAGTVYVGDLDRVQEFSPEGAYTGQITLPGAGAMTALAVDAGGDVYVKSAELSGVRKYDGAGVELGEPRDASGQPLAITLGPAGELFVNDVEISHRILEFDSAGTELASFDSDYKGFVTGIAYGESAGKLYVLSTTQVRLLSPPAAGPLLVTGSESAGGVQPTTATLGALVNAEGHETTYHFEYGASAAYGSSTATTTLGGGFEDEAISAEVGQLQPRTLYHFRIVAENSAGTTFGPDETFTTLPPALIEDEWTAGISARSATLVAQLDPLGRDTTYHFEYGLSAAYGTSVPVPDADAGSGTGTVTVNALVEDLVPGSTYHYRLVAHNALGTIEGPDRTLTTRSGGEASGSEASGSEASALPDGRAWELVSPPDKRGFSLESLTERGGPIQASADGSAIAYVANGPIESEAKGNRSFEYAEILARHGADGWSSQDIATPHEALTVLNFDLSEYRMFSPDLSVGLFEPRTTTPLSPQATEHTPYRREADGEYTPLVTPANVPPGTRFGQLNGQGNPETGDVSFKGATSDLSHIVLASSQALQAGIGVQGIEENLFEWSGGSLRLVSELPDGKAATEEGVSAELGYQNLIVRHAISRDGTRIFWASAGHLYMRDIRHGQTLRLDAVQPGARGGSGTAAFASASSDGAKVFFTDTSRLTADSTTTARSGDEEPDLYMCEIGEGAGHPACALKDLSVDHNSGEAADVLGTVIEAGEDGRYVYFVANGVLEPGATRGGCSTTSHGETFIEPSGVTCNLYVADTVTGETRLIARLAARDIPDWAPYFSQLGGLTAGTSPDGRYLAFMSERSLTGYDNIDVHSGQPDEEVFVYDAASDHLLCASCNPTGARPAGALGRAHGDTRLIDRPANWEGRWVAASLPGWTYADRAVAYYRSRYLSDSGRLFFNAADALEAQDTNGTEDVYEYEPNGVGSCRLRAGCLGLISAGTSAEESAFLDASESGDDAFFLTASRLAPQDLDGALDVYDARVCSQAAPCPTQAQAQAPCASADACRAAASGEPGVLGAAGSATFSGAGNLVPAAPRPVARSRKLTAAQRLARALRQCRAKPKRRRAPCEAQARRRYRATARAKRSHRTSGSATTTRRGSR